MACGTIPGAASCRTTSWMKASMPWIQLTVSFGRFRDISSLKPSKTTAWWAATARIWAQSSGPTILWIIWR
ncbi:hypothetical protein D3C85_1707400 [compost metagenome]